MRESQFRNWLAGRIEKGPINNYVSWCKKVESDLHLDLDAAYHQDRGNSLLKTLAYSMDDQRNDRPCALKLMPYSNKRNCMASYRTATKKYMEFCEDDYLGTADEIPHT